MNEEQFDAIKARVVGRMEANGATQEAIDLAVSKIQSRKKDILSKKMKLQDAPDRLCPMTRFFYTDADRARIEATARVREEVSGIRGWEGFISSRR